MVNFFGGVWCCRGRGKREEGGKERGREFFE